MGYNTITVAPGSTTALGVQFENVANAEAGIPIKSLVSYADVRGATSADNMNCDRILVYTGYGWTTYFAYRKNFTATPYWCLSTDETHEELKDDVAIKAGQCVFFYRAANAASQTSLSLAGGVVPLSQTKNYTVAPGSTTAMAWPWPEAMKVKDISKYYSDIRGATSADNMNCDRLLVYTGYGWTTYFAYRKNFTATPYWCLSTDETHEELKDDVIIPSGSGFFFYRAANATGDTIISFEREK